MRRDRSAVAREDPSGGNGDHCPANNPRGNACKGRSEVQIIVNALTGRAAVPTPDRVDNKKAGHVKRAIRAASNAGLTVTGIEIKPDGGIAVMSTGLNPGVTKEGNLRAFP
jgi:hypothetical protein